MATRKSKGLLQITNMDIFEINEVIRQIQSQLDSLNGLSGQTTLPSDTYGSPSDVAAAAEHGDSGLISQSDHVHAHGSGYLPDAHHAKSHVHTGDGSGTVAESSISFTDITTNNVSTSKHGYTPKLPNDAAKYLNGVGAFAYLTPVHQADASAANDTIYFSTDANKLVYKDAGGVVNNLY